MQPHRIGVVTCAKGLLMAGDGVAKCHNASSLGISRPKVFKPRGLSGRRKRLGERGTHAPRVESDTHGASGAGHRALLDHRVGIDGESGPRSERVADLLPLRRGQEEGLEPAEVLRALDGEVAGLDLVADLEEQRALPTATVRLAVVTDERLQRRWGEVDRHIGRQAAAPRRAVFAVGP